MTITKAQRSSLFKVWERDNQLLTYRDFRRTVLPGAGCILVPWCGMYLGIEPDGYTHS